MPDIYSKGGTVDYGDGFYIEDLTNKRNFRSMANNPVPEKPPEESPKTDKKKEPPKKNKGCGCVFHFIIIVISLLLIGTGIYMILVLSRVHYTSDRPLHNSEVEAVSKSGIENILLIGEDNHKDNEHGRADTMILLTIDKNKKKMKLTSFMRDIYIDIPGYGYGKLNSAYAYGGALLTMQTIEENFRIKIDKYILVDFDSFTSLIDSVGGIDLALDRDEIEYINMQSYKNRQTDKKSELDPDSYDYNVDGEAMVHLNGRQALWYARDRDSAGSDFDRTKRQRTLILKLMSDLSVQMYKLIPAGFSISPYLTTNMNSVDLTMRGVDIAAALRYVREENRVPLNNNYYDDYYSDSGQVLCIYDYNYEIEELHKFVFG